MKKTYIRPEIEIQELHLETAILTMSPGDESNPMTEVEVDSGEETEEYFTRDRIFDHDIWH